MVPSHIYAGLEDSGELGVNVMKNVGIFNDIGPSTEDAETKVWRVEGGA